MLASRVSTWPRDSFLPQHDRSALIETHNVERVLADIDANHRDRSIEFLRHGVLLALVAPMPALLAGGAGARPDHSISGHWTRVGGTGAVRVSLINAIVARLICINGVSCGF